MTMQQHTLKVLTSLLKNATQANTYNLFQAIKITPVKPTLASQELEDVRVIVNYLLSQNHVVMKRHSDLIERFFAELGRVGSTEQAVVYLSKVYESYQNVPQELAEEKKPDTP